MKTLHLQQGSSEWLAHRRTTRNASDAPAMMGASPYVSRSELVRRAATGLEREVDAITQARFDRGHELEPKLRALAEAMIGEDLYPVVGVSDDGYLGASLDGMTLTGDVILEVKQPNAEKQTLIAAGEIPPADLWQIVQQFDVCETAQRCIYLVGDGTEEGTWRLDIQRVEIEGLIPRLRAGWQQFDADVAAYTPEAAPAPAPVGRAPDALPALSVVARGMVEYSNLADFREKALAAISTVNRDLQTDDDFATAELTIKAFKAGEEKLDATKAQILGQMADVDQVMRTIDEVSGELRRVRLELDKLVKAEKESRKAELLQTAAQGVREHYDALNAGLGEYRIQPPQSLTLDLGGAIRGKKSLASMKDALSTAAAQIKVAASQQAERVRACAAIIAEHPGHAGLLPDRVQLCAAKQPDDLRNLVAARVAEFERAEEQRRDQERERIRQEEADRLQREQQAEADRIERERAQAESAGNAEPVAAPAPTAASTAAGGTAAAAATGGASVSTLPAQQQPVAAAAPAIAPDVRIKLGDINALIAPLSITADGLSQLGFRPVGQDRAAKLYAAAELPAICARLVEVINQAPARAAERIAA